MKKRLGLYLPLKVERELDYFCKEYHPVTPQNVLLTAFSLVDRKQLVQLLSLKKGDSGS